jgi:hypothetical protein
MAMAKHERRRPDRAVVHYKLPWTSDEYASMARICQESEVRGWKRALVESLPGRDWGEIEGKWRYLVVILKSSKSEYGLWSRICGYLDDSSVEGDLSPPALSVPESGPESHAQSEAGLSGSSNS